MSIASLDPGMLYHQLVIGAKEAQEEIPIKVPEDMENFKEEEYPHWVVFAGIHLGQAFDQVAIFENAKIIAKIPDDQIMNVTPKDLMDMGAVLVGGRWD